MNKPEDIKKALELEAEIKRIEALREELARQLMAKKSELKNLDLDEFGMWRQQ